MGRTGPPGLAIDRRKGEGTGPHRRQIRLALMRGAAIDPGHRFGRSDTIVRPADQQRHDHNRRHEE
jgi:hypothetical protein